MSLETFHFLRPEWFLALIPLTVFLIFTWRRRAHHNAFWQKHVDAHLMNHVVIDNGSKQNHRHIYLMAAIAMLCIVALAGPVWEKVPQPVYQAPVARVIMLDLSQSMNSTDLKPSRIERSKFKILELLKQPWDGLTSLIVFSDQAFTLIPLTQDTDIIAEVVASLSPDIMPSQGSEPQNAIAAALHMLEDTAIREAQFVLFTDGVNSMASSSEIAQNYDAARWQLTVFGIGTEKGAPIPSPQGGFIQQKGGAPVIARLETAALQQFSSFFHGRYVTLSLDQSDLHALSLETFDSRLVSNDETQKREADAWREEGPWLLLIILPLTALLFRRGIVFSLVVLAIHPVNDTYAFEWRNIFKTQDQQGQTLFDQENYSEAAQRFQDPIHRGAAHYRNGDYEAAANAFSQSQSADAHYNRGNALAKLNKLDEALEAYQHALDLEPQHEDAEFNRKLIESLKQQENQSNDQQSQENGDNSESSQQSQQSEQQQSQNNDDTQQQNSAENQPSNQMQDEQEQAQQQQDSANQNSQTQEDEQQAQETQQHASQQPEDADEAIDSAQMQLSEEELDTESTETSQEMDLWLRRVPDNSATLWQRKLQHQYRHRNADTQNNGNNW